MFNRTRIVKRVYPSGNIGYFVQKQNSLFFWLYKDCHYYPINTLDFAQKSEYIFKPFKNRVVEVYKIKFRVIEQFYNNGEFRGFFVQQRDPLFFWLWRSCNAIRYNNADDAKNSVDYWHNRSKEIAKEVAEAKKRRCYDIVVPSIGL